MITKKKLVAVSACLLASLAIPTFISHSLAQTPAQSVCKIEVRSGYRYIDANGLPDHSTGTFPNRGNPNAISPQDYHFRVPLHPTPADVNAREARGITFGVAINGVPFDPGTAERWNNDRRWSYEALTGLLGSRGSLGADENFAHVQPTGAYHYHGLPMGLLRRLNYQSKMVLIGYAADGYPIYGPFCFRLPGDSRSGLKMMKSSYRLKNSTRPGGTDGPGGTCDGSFAQDYEFISGAGDLDEYNGRTGITPEYPGGTFYYVVTDNWPFIPRKFKGTPDDSFRKGPPGGRAGGGQGGRFEPGQNNRGGNRPGPMGMPGDGPPGGGFPGQGFPGGRQPRVDGPPGFPGGGFPPGRGFPTGSIPGGGPAGSDN